MLEIGKTATATTIVCEENTAKAVGSGSLSVFSTPMMIALMEQAACECLVDALEAGQTSVGTMINVEHLAASALGTKISATARVEKIDGKKVFFTVDAYNAVPRDDSGIDDYRILIGKGTHERFIVDAARFMAKL